MHTRMHTYAWQCAPNDTVSVTHAVPIPDEPRSRSTVRKRGWSLTPASLAGAPAVPLGARPSGQTEGLARAGTQRECNQARPRRKRAPGNVQLVSQARRGRFPQGTGPSPSLLSRAVRPHRPCLPDTMPRLEPPTQPTLSGAAPRPTGGGGDLRGCRGHFFPKARGG